MRHQYLSTLISRTGTPQTVALGPMGKGGWSAGRGDSMAMQQNQDEGNTDMTYAPTARARFPFARLALTCTLLIAVSTPVFAQKRADCKTCHPQPATQLPTSVHNALQCQECHGGRGRYDLAADVIARYTRRPAPGETRPAFDHGEKFVGKAKRSEIPSLCGTCHADVARMNRYGIPTDQLSRYWTSGHGKTLKEKGDDRVAVCIDCHGTHDISKPSETASKTYPKNVPDTCGKCHGDEALMSEFGRPVGIMNEYRKSVHGNLLIEQGDLGAPTCATCHGSHGSAPRGFVSVRTSCGQCHQAAAQNFATSIHASLEEHKGCVQCHGGGPDAHAHLIQRITKPAGILIQRYEHLMSIDPTASEETVAETINPNPKQIIMSAIDTCTECHDDLEDDESLPKLFDLIDQINAAEKKYVETAAYLDKVARGVILVEKQQFEFEDAKTYLIALAPLQHTLDNKKIAAKVGELNKVCDLVTDELKDLEANLDLRYKFLTPMWGFAIIFSIALYAKYKQLKRRYVKPLPTDAAAVGDHAR